MLNQLNYFPVLSLNQMAFKRIAVALVNNPDILATAQNFSLENATKYYRSEWYETASPKITDAVSKLPLPPKLKSEIVQMLKVVGSEILNWRTFHKLYVGNFSAHTAKELCWTTAGTVDYRKTSEILVRSTLLDNLQRFELACFYCLEDYVPTLWDKMSEEDKRTFYKEEPLQLASPHPLLFLPYVLKKSPSLSSLTLVAVRCHLWNYAAMCGNKAATEYCLCKLPTANREFSLFVTAQCVLYKRSIFLLSGPSAVPGETFPGETFPDVLRYLLSLLHPKSQLLLFMAYSHRFLLCFLNWPSNDLFLGIADVIWKFLPEDEYVLLLMLISNYIHHTAYYLQNGLQEFFLRCPKNFTKIFADYEYLRYSFFKQFFRTEDSQSIKVVFRRLDVADRVKLVFGENILRLFDESLLQDGWPMVELCIREALLSAEDRQRLREAFAEHLRSTGFGLEFDWKMDTRKRFFEFLDEMDASTGKKRNAEVEIVTHVKKVCNDGHDTLPRN